MHVTYTIDFQYWQRISERNHNNADGALSERSYSPKIAEALIGEFVE